MPLGVVNRNNRKYSEEVVQKALDDLDGRPVPVQLDMPREGRPEEAPEIDAKNIQGFADLTIKDHCLVTELRIKKSTDIGKFICNGLDDGSLVPAPFGTCTEKAIDGVNEISDFLLYGIGIIDRQRSAWDTSDMSTGLFSSAFNLIADTADSVVDVASSATKAGARGVKRVANDAEKLAKDVVDPLSHFSR